jgi:hypothetical protein
MIDFLEVGGRDAARGPFATVIDAAYAINVRDNPARRGPLLEHLAPFAFPNFTIHQPLSGPTAPPAIWEAHAAVARHALAAGREQVLIMEDDVFFTVGPEKLARRITAASKRLPQDWWALLLGHFPVAAYPVAPGLTRARSSMAHAYIASRPLLEWLATARMNDPLVPRDFFGWGIDAAYALLPGFHALLPMLAFQRPFPAHRADMRPDRDVSGAARPLWSPMRWRSTFFWHGPRVAEVLTLLASPISAFTLERSRRRRVERHFEHMAKLRALYGLDEERYLSINGDIERIGMPALWHYDRWGRAEGRVAPKIGEAD